jgi:hypothetical protein
MMNLSTRQELTQRTGERYRRSKDLEKRRILDDFVATTGYHRKYAITVLNEVCVRPQAPPRKRRRKPIYTPPVARALLACWSSIAEPCAKRLVPFLGELVQRLEAFGELQIEPEDRKLLLSMSVSTADRLLAQARRSRQRGLSTTKPSTWLKHQIPVHTSADPKEPVPGYTEIDLVAHCGESTQGYYLNTLTVTDLETGWTECSALLHRSQENVLSALAATRTRLPFALLGIDSDNGSEFINRMLFDYCRKEHIRFHRCRPYKKNDQAHVEQKNGSIVRRLAGYDRYEGVPARRLLEKVHRLGRLQVNFFQPTMKLIAKERNGARVRKTYDSPKTPYQRVMACTTVSQEEKDRLTALYHTLNPAQIARQLREAQAALRLRAIRPSSPVAVPEAAAHTHTHARETAFGAPAAREASRYASRAVGAIEIAAPISQGEI